MIIQIHADRNEKLIILNIDSFITKFDTLNSDDAKNRAKNRKNINIYLNAKLNQYFEIFENDNSLKNSDKNTSSDENLYDVISDEDFDREVNQFID